MAIERYMTNDPGNLGVVGVETGLLIATNAYADL